MIETVLYQLKNWNAHWRAITLGRAVQAVVGYAGLVTMRGTVHAKLIRANPKWWQRREVNLGLLGSRVVTTAGVNYMRDDFNAATGSADITNMKFHASGTNNTAENVADTALGTEVATRVSGSQSGAVSKIYVTVATIPYTGTLAIVEHGIFSAAAVGTLWDRTVFAAINVVNGDSIQFTYSLTINDGG